MVGSLLASEVVANCRKRLSQNKKPKLLKSLGFAWRREGDPSPSSLSRRNYWDNLTITELYQRRHLYRESPTFTREHVRCTQLNANADQELHAIRCLNIER
ncbi:hypothetical protein EBU99_15220 [bacterium]|nr:hypothetical protein [bacterium]